MRQNVSSNQMLLLFRRFHHQFRTADLQSVIETILEVGSFLLEIDRMAYCRFERARGEFILAKGYGRNLALPGTIFHVPVQLTPNKLISKPTAGTGWDAYYFFDQANQQPGLLAFDDTLSARNFTDEEVDILLNFVDLFMETYQTKRLFDTNARRANQDNLTKLPNQRKFIAELTLTIEEIKGGHHKQACLAIIDIDLFKKCNDTYGHQFGDVVLQTLGDMLNKNFNDAGRLTDATFAARYGGEEFVVIVKDRLETATRRLDSLLREFRAFNFGPGIAPITFSAGVIQFDHQSIDLTAGELGAENAIFSQADAKLYEAKAAGRNQIKS